MLYGFRSVLHTELTRLTPNMIEWLNELDGYWQVEFDRLHFTKENIFGGVVAVNFVDNIYLTLCFQYEEDAVAFKLRWTE